MHATPLPCPLCAAPNNSEYHRDERRVYRQCQCCQLVFVPSDYHLTHDQEKAEYDKHRNDEDDPGYRRFLSRLAKPLSARLPPASHGLDFGCGPGPALAAMLREAGHSVSLYDIYYHPDRTALTRQYDFITTTEVVEHLAEPGRELFTLWKLLKPGGMIGLMTKRVIDREHFARWHYIRDPTHIAFFNTASLHWVARKLAGELMLFGDDVAILVKLAR